MPKTLDEQIQRASIVVRLVVDAEGYERGLIAAAVFTIFFGDDPLFDPANFMTMSGFKARRGQVSENIVRQAFDGIRENLKDLKHFEES